MKKILKLASYSIFTSLFISIPIFNLNNNEKSIYSFKQEAKKHPFHEYNEDKTEIKKLGYYKHPTTKKVTIRPIPYHVNKVPEELPKDIESLYRAFAFRYEHHKPVTGFEKWDTSKITDMSYAFYDNHLINTDLSTWKTDSVNNMQGMFKNATMFNNEDKSLSWTTNNVENMESMFDGAKSFKQNLMGWNVDKVTKNKNFSRGSGIYNDQNKKPKWKNLVEQNEPIVEKTEEKKLKEIVHSSPVKSKTTIPWIKIVTPVTKSTSSPKTTPKPNSSLVIPKSTMTQNTTTKKLSTPAIVGIVVGTQAILTSLGFGIPYIIKKIKK
ncbi:BspA family leucine-rich repeat surface protein [Mycoplasma feriruminatoris]|uniref:Uncharacterized protein n=1 Tax=Mycoplasma feriruminatoris TaxID=1179777 RepID=A0AAX3TDY0_9MOLU|nr:BspA family leucine-rich repeat surface protein [Mycoplasma feriruminatoris]WFQ92360.1 hypothetical protein MFERI14822_00121 [Mycoplasma feriruminatoris]